MRLILKIYDVFKAHRMLWLALLGAIVAVCVVLIFRLDFKEDITDFLPVDEDYHESMKIYQEISTADKIVVMFSMADNTVDKQKVIESVERYWQVVAEHDTAGWTNNYESKVDYTQITDIFDYVYHNLPYYLTENDYIRIDSLWRDDKFLRERMDWVKEQISSPMSSLFEPMYVLDPLGLGENIATMLRDFQPETKYTQYNGYLFTEDEKKCLVSLTSPFGGSETNNNGQLVALLRQAGDSLAADGVKVTLLGSPAIAVTNATQIKHDTILAVSISALFIMVLLLYFFRSLKPLLHIALTTGFGFLFALGCIGIFRDSISLIVIGIASIIIGIAVNYPLHYVWHLRDFPASDNMTEPQTRRALKDLVAPLVIGNITTVGAFLALVPLEAVAIRDLGLFSALMLVGTIIFVLVFLPQIQVKGVKKVNEVKEVKDDRKLSVFEKITGNRVFSVLFILVSAFFGYYSLETEFDTNMSHINYMTQEEREGMAALAAMRGETDGTVVYVTSTADDYDSAVLGLENLQHLIGEEQTKGCVRLVKNPSRILPSRKKQTQNLALWKEFWQNHDITEFVRVAKEEGFTDDAFEEFVDMTTQTDFPLIAWEENETLTTTIFNGYVGANTVVEQLIVPTESVDELEKKITQYPRPDLEISIRAFDLTSLNGRIADTLSSDFNYIGFACSIIVFVFLWISFGRIELAIIAFLPMAFGWIWILGLMKLLGISFNIVNIILATFIFGQGDDYTIFITEGLIKEYKEGGKVLVSYQKSIILSALIMLVGIGSLIIARHPAMHSLAEVTIIGMFVVVFMAWLIPPVAFRLFVKYDKSLRNYLSDGK